MHPDKMLMLQRTNVCSSAFQCCIEYRKATLLEIHGQHALLAFSAFPCVRCGACLCLDIYATSGNLGDAAPSMIASVTSASTNQPPEPNQRVLTRVRQSTPTVPVLDPTNLVARESHGFVNISSSFYPDRRHCTIHRPPCQA